MDQIERLLKGFERFQERYFDAEPELFDALKSGQHPSTLMIGCSDSRVDPGLLLGYGPGELFTVRNIANLVPPCEVAGHDHNTGIHGVSAAIQFAVAVLQVEHIIVMGHAGCGGIQALMAPPRTAAPGEPDFITPWVQIAEPARRQVELNLPDADEAQRVRACEQAAILVSLRNLRTFPWVQNAVAAGHLTLHGWYFDIAAGALLAYSDKADAFRPLVCPITPHAEPHIRPHPSAQP
jgi:carbonic anhydrase